MFSIELARHLQAKYSATPMHMFVSAMRSPNAPIINRKLNYLLPRPQFIQHLRKVRGLAGRFRCCTEQLTSLRPLSARRNTTRGPRQRRIDGPVFAHVARGLQNG